MKRPRIMAVMVMLFALLTLVGCEEEWDEFWGGWYLEGAWTVTEFDGARRPLASYGIYIDQTASSLQFLRGGELRGYGRIFDDTISCDDWSGHGITRLYIESDRHLRSSATGGETVRHLELDRID